MTDRDMLIELFKGAESKVMEELNKHLELDEEEWMGIYADYFIANGVIVSPCKVGDILYEICERRRNNKWEKVIAKRVVHGIEIGLNGSVCARCGTTITVFFSGLGKTVFLTREEAEKALERSKGNETNI